MVDTQGRLRQVYSLLSIGWLTERDDMVGEARSELGRLISDMYDDGADQVHESKVDEGLEQR